MKDLPHHIKKLNRQVIRSAHHEQMEEDFFDAAYRKEMTPHQIKKQKKEVQKQARSRRVPSDKTPDEQNAIRKHRTPQRVDRPAKTPRPSR